MPRQSSGIEPLALTHRRRLHLRFGRLQDRLYYCALRSPPTSSKILLRNQRQEKVPVKCFNVDEELIYWNFFLDFGPLNLGQLFRFTVKLNNLLVEQNKNDKNHPVLLFYSSTVPAKRTNAIYLICAWQVLEMKRTPEQAFFAFQYYLEHEEDDPPAVSSSSSSSSRRRKCSFPPPVPLTSIGKATVAPLPSFHDASPVSCSYDLTLMDCLEGLVKARQLDFFNWDGFNVEEYEYYEQVEVRTGRVIMRKQDRVYRFAHSCHGVFLLLS